MQSDSTHGLGLRVLYCLTCAGFRDHEVGEYEDDSGHLEAICLDCDATMDVLPGLGTKVAGITPGARGPYEVHIHRLGYLRRWYRSCRPRSQLAAADHVVPHQPTDLHPLCHDCESRELKRQ